MKRFSLALLALPLLACAPPRPTTVWADPSFEAPAERAVAMWAAAGADLVLVADRDAAGAVIEPSTDGRSISGYAGGTYRVAIRPDLPEGVLDLTIAHELGHVLAGDGEHAPGGLMRAQARALDLLEAPRCIDAWAAKHTGLTPTCP